MMEQRVEEVHSSPLEIARQQRKWTTWLFLAVYSLFLLGSIGYIAAHRHLWFDEVQAFFISGQPSFQLIWQTLLRATDGTPFGFYVPVHLSQIFFGPSNLSLRLCAVIPFWLTTVVLYLIVARRTSPLYGFIAALAPPFTVAFQYSFEARPYALVLFFSTCSFLAWQFAKQNQRRALALPAITIALAAAISVHYNAILLPIPLLIGEAVYTVRRRKVDIGVLAAIGVSFFPILLLLPHIRAIHIYSQSSWTHTNFAALFEIYFTLLTKFFVLGVIGCAGFGIWAALWRVRKRDIDAELGTIPHYEIAAAAGYLLLPIALFILSLYTKAFHYRYALATVIGLSIFIPYFLWMFRGVFYRVAAVLCCLLALSLLYTAGSRMRTPDEESWGTFAGYSELFNPGTAAIYRSDEPLVLGDGPFFITAKYGSSALRRRSFYVMTKKDWNVMSPVMFRGIEGVVPGPFQLVELNDFKRQHRSFLMYEPDTWLFKRLVAEGDDVRVIANLQHDLLYQVHVK